MVLIEVRTLSSLRHELSWRAERPANDPDQVDAFLIDVLWRASGAHRDWTFGELDPAFDQERVMPLDAGAQLVGLMRNRRFEAARPRWLRAYEQHPMAVLTSLTDCRGTLDRYVDEEIGRRLTVLAKDVVGEDSEPDAQFRAWIDGLIP
jgi:hypothetical protein